MSYCLYIWNQYHINLIPIKIKENSLVNFDSLSAVLLDFLHPQHVIVSFAFLILKTLNSLPSVSLARTSSIMLNRSGYSRHYLLTSYISRKAFNIFHLTIMFSVAFVFFIYHGCVLKHIIRNLLWYFSHSSKVSLLTSFCIHNFAIFPI